MATPELSRRGWLQRMGAGLAAAGWAAPAPHARTAALQRLQVGPQRALRSLAAAAQAAGQTPTLIELDAGDYRGDDAVALWDRAQVTVRAVNGRARLQADGAHVEGKGLWVVRASQLQVEGLDFLGARVPDGNGAGIRLESGQLSVRDCAFGRCENGLLAGNQTDTRLTLQDCEFGYNGAGDGQTHNLYVGTIADLRVSGCWSHHARVGHLLKSRAARSLVQYCLLADGAQGQASYELEFANGGVCTVLGNVIQQSASTENPHLVSYGVEGLRWPDNRLAMAHNTLVDARGNGIALRTHAETAAVVLRNNLLIGSSLRLPEHEGSWGNLTAYGLSGGGAPTEWRPGRRSRLAAAARPAGTFDGHSLTPTQQPALLTRGQQPRSASPGAGALAPAAR